MNNYEFEINMINTVNRRADAVKYNRMVAESAAREDWEINRKANVFRAIVEVICLVLCFLTCIYAMWALNWLGRVPAVLAVSTSAVVSFAIGMRVNSLARIIKK